MRRLLGLAGLLAAGWWLLRRGREAAPRAVVGYVDGSSITLEDGSPELERLVTAARKALSG